MAASLVFFGARARQGFFFFFERAYNSIGAG